MTSRFTALVMAALFLTACSSGPSEAKVRCDQFCADTLALVDDDCRSSDNWEQCKPWIDKVSALADKIGADAKGKEVGYLNHYVSEVAKPIKGYVDNRCDERLDVTTDTGRFSTCQGHWRRIGVNLESLYLELNSAAKK